MSRQRPWQNTLESDKRHQETPPSQLKEEHLAMIMDDENKEDAVRWSDGMEVK
jgi:hypothetical protein